MIQIDYWILIQLVGLGMVLFTGLELILRKEGVRPAQKKTTKSEITPRDSFYRMHPELGFVNGSGEYHLNINDGDFKFNATHDREGHRITKPSDLNLGSSGQDKPRLWIFGCSFIYGWLVEDEETFPWLMQQELDDWEITNFSVSGYSTLQSYLQCKEALSKQPAPELIMVFYGSGIHDQRNVFSRNRKKIFTRLERISPFKVPEARLAEKGNIRIKYDKIKYNGLPFISYSALMNYLDNKLNGHLDSRIDQFEVSKAIIREFNSLCKKNDSQFIVGGILKDEKTREMLDYCRKQDISSIDIALDRRPEHVHDYDFHPSPLAHQKYANQLVNYLQYKGVLHQE